MSLQHCESISGWGPHGRAPANLGASFFAVSVELVVRLVGILGKTQVTSSVRHGKDPGKAADQVIVKFSAERLARGVTGSQRNAGGRAFPGQGAR